MNCTLYLHVGSHKTGTSSIQETFFRSIDALRRRGIDYFQYASNHSAAFYWLFSEKRNQYHVTLKERLSLSELNTKREEIDKELRLFLSENSYRVKVISGEDISSLREEEVLAIRNYLRGIASLNIKVIIYIRNYYDFLDSTVQELIKNGKTLEDIETGLLERGPVPRYRFRIRKFNNVFGRENVLVRIFNSELFKDGDLLADFCDAINAPQAFHELTKVITNTSMSAESVRLMDKYNKLFPVRVGDSYNGARTEKVKSYLVSTSGPKFQVSDSKMLANYERLIADDKEFIRREVGDKLAAYVLERKHTTDATHTAADLPSDFEQLLNAFGKSLLDVQNFEKALEIILSVLPPASGDDDTSCVARSAKFISSDLLCRQLSRALMRAQKNKCATVLALRAVELNPTSLDNHELVGDVFRAQDNWVEAELAYTRVVTMDPNNSSAQAKLNRCRTAKPVISSSV